MDVDDGADVGAEGKEAEEEEEEAEEEGCAAEEEATAAEVEEIGCVCDETLLVGAVPGTDCTAACVDVLSLSSSDSEEALSMPSVASMCACDWVRVCACVRVSDDPADSTELELTLPKIGANGALTLTVSSASSAAPSLNGCTRVGKGDETSSPMSQPDTFLFSSFANSLS